MPTELTTIFMIVLTYTNSDTYSVQILYVNSFNVSSDHALKVKITNTFLCQSDYLVQTTQLSS